MIEHEELSTCVVMTVLIYLILRVVLSGCADRSVPAVRSVPFERTGWRLVTEGWASRDYVSLNALLLRRSISYCARRAGLGCLSTVLLIIAVILATVNGRPEVAPRAVSVAEWFPRIHWPSMVQSGASQVGL